jgi:uncharacterized protein with FMN-binding domain
MRRSTAAAVGTLTGAALIVGVRLSVQPPAAPAAQSVNVADDATPDPATTKKPAGSAGAAGSSGSSGSFKGKGATNPYGTVQVTIKIANGKITAVDATYPTAGNSATINPVAIPKLKQETLQAQSAKVAAVSGATYTSGSYQESLQAALDSAKA